MIILEMVHIMQKVIFNLSNSNYKITEHDIDDFERENPSTIKSFKLSFTY